MVTAETLLLTAALITLPRGQAVEVTEDWDYVRVREDAHMFWWLYYTQHPTKDYTQVPLVMWLQGGPGASSCGFGNFEEIGPRDVKLHPRNSTWAQVCSLLFVDSPVGTGYSFTTDSAAFASDIETVSRDLLLLLTHFFKAKTEFQKIPFYIFSESYGGKMAAAIALELHKAIAAGSIPCTLGGVALGDSWISPIDSVLSWGPYLYSMSLLDDKGLSEVQAAADAVQDALTKKNFSLATELWSKTEDLIEENTDGVNFYNILGKESLMSRSSAHFTSPYVDRLFRRHVRPLHSDPLDELMNGPIRAKLKIIPDAVQWGGQETWVKRLKWKNVEKFRALHWRALHRGEETAALHRGEETAALHRGEETAAFYKIYDNLSFYWILKAGHMVPSDQPITSLQMLRMILDQH